MPSFRRTWTWLITSIYDGIQRPLDDIMKVCGNNLNEVLEVPSLKRDKNGTFVPSCKAGDEVEAGDILGTVQETSVVHRNHGSLRNQKVHEGN